MNLCAMVDPAPGYVKFPSACLLRAQARPICTIDWAHLMIHAKLVGLQRNAVQSTLHAPRLTSEPRLRLKFTTGAINYSLWTDITQGILTTWMCPDALLEFLIEEQ